MTFGMSSASTMRRNPWTSPGRAASPISFAMADTPRASSTVFADGPNQSSATWRSRTVAASWRTSTSGIQGPVPGSAAIRPRKSAPWASDVVRKTATTPSEVIRQWSTPPAAVAVVLLRPSQLPGEVLDSHDPLRPGQQVPQLYMAIRQLVAQDHGEVGAVPAGRLELPPELAPGEIRAHPQPGGPQVGGHPQATHRVVGVRAGHDRERTVVDLRPSPALLRQHES